MRLTEWALEPSIPKCPFCGRFGVHYRELVDLPGAALDPQMKCFACGRIWWKEDQ